MSSLVSVPLNSADKDLPLPIIVAKKWNFPLAYHVEPDGYFYAIQDWIAGLIQAENVRKIWSDIKRKGRLTQLSDSIRQLAYVADDGKTYQVDFTDDIGLYLIAQNLRVTKERPLLGNIKDFLAESGAFVDLVRRVPETVITSGAIDPDAAIDAAIEAYRKRGKDDRWIGARIDGKIKRAKFTAALKAAVDEMLTRQHYALATDDIYVGLWGRTAAILKDELNLLKNASLRDNQPTLALIYQGLAEEVSARKLGDASELSWEEARQIVRTVADLIGLQAAETGKYLQMDIATGRPLLTAGQ